MTRGGEKLFGVDNPFYGHKHSDKTREKLSKIRIGVTSGENNNFYGKHHTEETKKIIGQKNSKKVAMLDSNMNIEKVFDSCTQAGKWCYENGLSTSKHANSDISKRCKDGKNAFGHKWIFFNGSVETMGDECNPVD